MKINKLKQWWCYHTHRKHIKYSLNLNFSIITERLLIEVSKLCKKCKSDTETNSIIFDFEERKFIQSKNIKDNQCKGGG